MNFGPFNLATLRRRLAGPIQILLDVGAWTVAATLAMYLRFGLDIASADRRGLIKVIPLVAGIQLIAGLSVGLYRARWRYGSFDEVAALLFSSLVTTGGVYVLNEFYFAARFQLERRVLWEPLEREFYEYQAASGLWVPVSTEGERESARGIV